MEEEDPLQVESVNLRRAHWLGGSWVSGREQSREPPPEAHEGGELFPLPAPRMRLGARSSWKPPVLFEHHTALKGSPVPPPPPCPFQAIDASVGAGGMTDVTRAVECRLGLHTELAFLKPPDIPWAPQQPLSSTPRLLCPPFLKHLWKARVPVTPRPKRSLTCHLQVQAPSETPARFPHISGAPTAFPGSDRSSLSRALPHTSVPLPLSGRRLPSLHLLGISPTKSRLSATGKSPSAFRPLILESTPSLTVLSTSLTSSSLI